MALTPQQARLGINAGNPDLVNRLGELIAMQPQTGLASGVPPVNPLATFAAAATPQNNAGLITDTFQQVLGRAPSAEVLQFYQNQLAQGLSPQEFQGQIANSPEALRRGETPQAPGAVGVTPPPTGVIGSEQALQGGLQASLDAVLQSIAQGREDVTGTGQQALDLLGSGSGQGLIERGVEGFDPFIGRGQQAGQLQAALSGALGPAAQARAFRDFQSSPGQDFLTGEIEKSILRNASATGGLGGGNVLRALQDRALGLAQTDFGNFFGRLGEVANQGLQGAGGAGGLLATGAGLAAGTEQAGANVLQNIGSQLGGFSVGGGQNIASLLTGAARDVSTGRTQAGRDISSAIGGTTSALSDLQERGGAGAADITGSGADVLANIINNAGQGLAGDELILAQLLANLATNEGSQLSSAQLARGGEVQGAEPGILGGIGQLASGVGGLLGAI